MKTISKLTISGIKLASMMIPLMTVLVLLTFYLVPQTQEAHRWTNIAKYPIHMMALYGLSSVLLISTIFTTTSTSIKKYFTILTSVLVAMAIPANLVMALTIPACLLIILYIFSKKVGRKDVGNALLNTTIVGIISVLIIGQIIAWTLGEGYKFLVDTLMLLVTFYMTFCLVGGFFHILLRIPGVRMLFDEEK